MVSVLYSQDCNGNLGDNIFADGDFGIGGQNLVLTDPMIAPGYQYTTVVPPFDGQYVITNGTQFWPNLYDSWLMIGDNSPNTSGYMMVVNADFEPGDFFSRTVDGLCPGTTYNFSADVINLIRTGTPDHIDPNVSFLLDGQVVITTGDIPKNQQWMTFVHTFTTGPTQEQVELTLRNNAPGGNGNDLALDNIKFEPCGPDMFVETNPPGRLCVDADSLILIATVDASGPAFYQWQRSTNNGAS